MSSQFIEISKDEDNFFYIKLRRRWTIANAPDTERSLKKLPTAKAQKIIIDGSELKEIDPSGAWMLAYFIRSFSGKDVEVVYEGLEKHHAKILDIIEHIEHPHSLAPEGHGGVFNFFKHVGILTLSMITGLCSFVAFFGQFCAALGTVIIKPKRLRLRSLVYHLNEIGIKAIPIVALMAFLISIVLGYQGAAQLSQFGATLFTIDLVAISVLREMGVLITAIMVAGRSGSAFAAQIGVMQVNEEVGAMATIGLDPFEMLVLPRILAILIALPILTFIADVVGLFGALFVSSTLLDISLLQFFERLKGVVSVDVFMIGLVKAPVFALLIGLVGCLQGMNVKSSAAEVGGRTTIAVVQSIILVILSDAVFSVIFTMVGI